MAKYELIFETDPLSQEQEDSVYEHFDALVAVHGPTTLVTLTADGGAAVEAVVQSVLQLRALGIEVVRLYEDLVDRGEIARRAGVTPQAVGLWVRGERHLEQPFPTPHNAVAGGVWLWGEVNDWLNALGKSDGFERPSRSQHSELNGWIVRRRSSESSSPFSTCRPTTVDPTFGFRTIARAHATLAVGTSDEWAMAADSKRTDFALGA